MSNIKEEYPRHWRCKVCGQSSPVTAYKCNNPQCGADLLVSGEIIFEETAPPPPPPPPPFDWEEVETEPKEKKPKQKKPKKEKVKREKPKKEKVQREKKSKEAKSGKGWLIGLAAVLAIALLAALALPRFGDSGNDTQLREPEIPTTTQTQPVATKPVDTVPDATDPLATEPPTTELHQTEPLEPWEINMLMKQSDSYYDTFRFNIEKNEIGSITFLDNLTNAPITALDISEFQTGGVLAWLVRNGELYDLYIAGEGGVFAPYSCKDLFGNFENLEKIDFNGAFSTEHVTDMTGMFWSCDKLTSLDVSEFDTSNVKNMSGMFSNCGALNKLNLLNFNTSNVTDMNNMFCACVRLTELDISGFDTSKVTDMSGMFSTMVEVEELNLSSFRTPNVINMSGMFANDWNLGKLDLSNFDFSNVTDVSGMLFGSASTWLDLGTFDTSSVTEYDGFMAVEYLPDGTPWIELFE